MMNFLEREMEIFYSSNEQKNLSCIAGCNLQLIASKFRLMIQAASCDFNENE